MTVLRVCYQHGVRFDHDYYMAKHLPLAAGVMGPFGVKNVEIMKVAATPDGSAPKYQVIFSAYFDSGAALQSAMQSARMPEVLGDIQKFFDGMPDVLIGEVVALPA